MSEAIENNEPELSAEAAADYARLESMMTPAAPGAPGEPVPEPEPQTVDAAESLGGFLTMISGGLGALAGMKQTAAVWTPETCQAGAAAVVPVLRKYPWGARFLAFFETGAGAEEMALVAFALPVGMATIAAVRSDLAPKEKTSEPDAEKTEPAAQVGAMVEYTGRSDANQ